jgi:hypothetical protein
MPIGVGTAILGAGALGAGASIFGATTAASAQKQAAADATNAELSMFNQAKTLAQPFVDFGTGVLSPLSKLITPGPDQTSTLEQTPGYQFALTQGEKGITNQATMNGLSGNALRAGSTFASGLAGQTFQNQVGNLLSAAGIGQSAASGVGGQAVATGGQIGSNIIGAGNASAAASIASGNAIGGIGNNFVSASLLNALTGGKLFGSTGLFGSNDGSVINSSGDLVQNGEIIPG